MDLALAQSGDNIEVADGTFGAHLNEALIHQVVTAYMAGGRTGTRAQKTRADVRGGGAKPWRQKGTGRARVGSSRNPLWRGGGVTFAARPQNHAQKVNRKAYRGAMRSILSELLRRERLIVVGDFSVSGPKTRELLPKLRELALDSVLIVTVARDTKLELASRNLQHVDVCSCAELDPVSLIAFDKVLMTVPALRAVEERLA